MRVILSGPSAVGKNTVAKSVASEFGLKMLTASDLLKNVAEDCGFSAEGDEWWDKEEAREFTADRETDHSLDQELDAKLKQILDEGNIALTSWTMPWLYEKEAVKILLKASQSTQAERMAKRDDISQKKALETVKERDEENRKLYQEIYGFDIAEDHQVFNLVVDTDRLDEKSVLKIVTEFLKAVSN